MISLKSISKSYGSVRALTNLTFTADRGEVLGYIGPNGAGKTTTLKILTGLIRDYRGTVEIDGVDLRSLAGGTHARIGYLPQDAGFQEWRTVEHALRTFGLLSGIPRDTLASATERVLEQAGIAEHRTRRISHLSGGTVQRLRLAQAILHDPDILILDEPLSGLDPASRFQVKKIISSLARENRLVLVSSHVLAELEGLATRICILHQGAIRESGTPAELRTRYQVGTVIEVVLRSGGTRTPGDAGAAGDTPAAATAVPPEWAVFAVNPDLRVEALAPDTVHLHVDPGLDADQAMTWIIRTIADKGMAVRSVQHLQPSLEQVYLQLTGGTE